MNSIDAILIQIRAAYIHIDLRSREPQLGQYYIAEYAHQYGFNVKVKSYSSNDEIIKSITSLILQNKCRIIGFYIDSENLWVVRRVTQIIKNYLSDLFIVIGGPQVTGDPELAMKRLPHIDCAIIGEGERPFTELLNCKLRASIELSEINGIAYRDSSKVLHFTNPQKRYDIDNYPWPRRYNYTLDKDTIFDQLSTGRGCIGQCTFCFEGNKQSNHLRLRSVDSVIEEIDYLVSHLSERKYLSFLDDTFIIDRTRTEKICKHLIDNYEGKVGWFCEGRVDILRKNLDILPMLKKAGCIRIQLGGESGNQKILESYKKQMKLEDLEMVVRKIYECGISSVYINFIIGGAFETIDSFNDTLEFARYLLNLAPGCAEVGSSLLTPYVGTPIRKRPEDFGLTITDYNFITGPDGFTPFCRTEELQNAKILQLKNLFDKELVDETMNIVPQLTNSQIMTHYLMRRDYDMFTNWYTCINEIEAYKNYFESQIDYGFETFSEIESEEILNMSIPYRTVQPISDGKYYFVPNIGGTHIELHGLQHDLFMLSSGKLCFVEIYSVLSKKYHDYAELRQRIINEYEKFDQMRLVVWKHLF